MSDPRIALDLTVARFDRAGTGVYTTQLAEALRPLLGNRLVPLAFGLSGPRGARKSALDRVAILIRDLWWTQHAVVRAARQAGARLLHLPAGLGPLNSTIPLIVTVHDLSVLRFPERFRRWFRTYARLVLPRVARSAQAVITVSRASKVDIVEQLGLAEDRVFVVPNGVDARFLPEAGDSPLAIQIRTKYDLPQAFALTVGSIEPRKNLVRVLHAVHQLQSRCETADITLMHAGPEGWLSDEVVHTCKRLGVESSVKFLGYVPPGDLPILYRLARLLIYPSLFEGFGLPVIEAMACGCPVVTSNVSSLPEVAGDAAILVDPTSVDAIAEAIARLWTDAPLQQHFRSRGLTRAQHFSWARAARDTVAVYEQVLGWLGSGSEAHASRG